MFPRNEVKLNDELGLVGLSNDSFEAGFEDLSGGAREQLSLLVRLGFAELLAQSEPFPLIFDDALVNTDAQRILRMQRVLYQAAKNTQILLFSCHGEFFDELGPDQCIDLSVVQ